MEKIHLYTLPFAGGSKYSYRGFERLAAAGIHLLPLDLPGRGSRMAEKLLTCVEAMADDLFVQLKDQAGSPYAIYGHSMGALLGYLITKRITGAGLPPPRVLFCSGSVGPSVREYDELRHLLPRDAFVDKLKELGGIPDELLHDEDLIGFFEPVLRSDFQAVETYVYQETTPFSVPIVVMIGSEEDITLEEAAAWQQETCRPLQVTVMKGHHFFIHEQQEAIVDLITEQLANKNPALYDGTASLP